MTLDRTSVSFAEAEGRFRYPQVLKWGDLDQRMRSALWRVVSETIRENLDYDEWSAKWSYNKILFEWLYDEFLNRQYGFVDDFDYNIDSVCASWKEKFQNADYLEIFDLLTFLIRSKHCPQKFAEKLAESLDVPYSPYRLIVRSKTIVPAVEDSQVRGLVRNAEIVFVSRFSGARSHLQSAFDAFNIGDYRAVVREAIHAVESAVRDVTGESSAPLSRALNRLDNEHVHPAMRSAFEKLYAYSSDEKGIRHALLFADNENVGFAEALFFVSACASFIAYMKLRIPE